VTLSVLGVGALVGGAFGIARQIVQKIDDPRTQFSWLHVLSSAGWGGALAPAAIAYAPVRFFMALSGVASGASEWGKEHYATAAFDIATALVPEGYHQVKAAAAKPGGLAARLNPKNWTFDLDTLGTGGGGIFKPKPPVGKEGALTEMANWLKGLGDQTEGVTIEVVLARAKGGKEILVAGINSSAEPFNEAQLAQLKAWGVKVAPQQTTGMERAPHAEENIAAFLQSIGATGLRWSRGIVGAIKPGGSSYVCETCKNVIRLVGGRVEEPH